MNILATRSIFIVHDDNRHSPEEKDNAGYHTDQFMIVDILKKWKPRDSFFWIPPLT